MPSPTSGSPYTNLGTLSGPIERLALLGGTKWGGGIGSGVTLTYSFPWGSSNLAYFAPGYGEGEQNKYASGLTSTEQAYVRLALKQISMYTNVKFVEVGDGQTSVGTLRFAKAAIGPSTEYAHAYLPGSGAVAGDVWLNANAGGMSDLSPRSVGYATVLHELCHALGLKHPFEGGVRLSSSLNNKDNTIMSYTAGYFTGENPLSLMPFDIAALQYLYGANKSFNSGNNVYTEATLASIFGADGTYSPINGFPTVTLWDSGGIDTFEARGPLIDLRQAQPNYLNGTITRFTGYQVVIAKGVVIENATALDIGAQIIGNSANNVLKGTSGTTWAYDYQGASIWGYDGNDILYADDAITRDGTNDMAPGTLYGGNGDDRLYGQRYRDALRGESGNDRLRGGGGNDYIDGGSGIDMVDYGDKAGSIWLVLKESAPQTVTIDGIDEDTIFSVENATGGSGNDTIQGGYVANTLYGQGGDDNLIGHSGNDWLVGGSGIDTLDGGASIDTIDYRSDSAIDAQLNGARLGIVRVGSASEDVVFSIENVHGSNYGDKISGDEANNAFYGGGGGDTLLGGTGNDRLVGGTGRDFLTGGSGADRFVWAQAGESATTGSTADYVVDFGRSAGDLIDLSALDANSGASGNNAFRFVGTAAFTGAGQVRYVRSSSDTYIYLNTDSDNTAEALIRLKGSMALASAHFVL